MNTHRTTPSGLIPDGPWLDRGLTLTHVMGGEPGWWMHSVDLSMGIEGYENCEALLRKLGYEFWVGHVDEHQIAHRLFHKKYDVSIASIPRKDGCEHEDIDHATLVVLSDDGSEIWRGSLAALIDANETISAEEALQLRNGRTVRFGGGASPEIVATPT